MAMAVASSCRAVFGRGRQGAALALGVALGAALGAVSCGQDSGPESPAPQTISPTTTTPLPAGFEPASTAAYVAKVKGLLTSSPATDAEVQAVTADPNALGGLIDAWLKQPEFQAKMLRFFRNAFQQGQISAVNLTDQLAQTNLSSRLMGNITDSFALTAWQLAMVEGRPFTEVITTDRYMLTPQLATFLAYLDNRDINDQGRLTDRIVQANKDFAVTLSHASGPVTLDQTLTPGPMFMHWYLPADLPMGCTDPLVFKSNTSLLFAYLFGTVFATTACNVTFATPPQFTDAEYDAWRMVRVRLPAAGETPTPFYDARAMRSSGELVLRVPRVGFFGTPAFFANWSTNTSNQARVTMNQALIVALGRSFDDTNNTVPLTSPGLDAQHASDPACYACHKTLDPMRQIFRQAYTLAYHEQQDPAQLALHGVFAVDGVTRPVDNVQELASALATHPRFATAWTQKLCFWANSASCSEDDPEFQRVATAFEKSGFSWKVLVRELLASPLVTGARDTLTFADQGMTISVARRDQLCAGMAMRLGIPNICTLGRAPGLTQLVPSDGYSRGATAPVMATDPSLFYRAATEQLCRVFADSVVDTTVMGKPSRYSSKAAEAAITDMTQTVMGLVPSDPRSALLRQILSDHFGKASKTAGITATDALKSTFVLACSAPTSISIGL